MWSGFEPEMITGEQLLASLGLDDDYPDADIPDWVMTELGVLAAKGDVTVGEFMLALQYVLEHTYAIRNPLSGRVPCTAYSHAICPNRRKMTASRKERYATGHNAAKGQNIFGQIL